MVNALIVVAKKVRMGIVGSVNKNGENPAIRRKIDCLKILHTHHDCITSRDPLLDNFFLYT